MNILKEVLFAIIITCMPILTKYIITVIETYSLVLQKRLEETKYSIMVKYVDEAENIIKNIVQSVNQTYVDDLKKSGNFTAEYQKEAFNKAFTTAEEMITDESKKAIMMVYGDINKYITTMIESYVNNS